MLSRTLECPQLLFHFSAVFGPSANKIASNAIKLSHYHWSVKDAKKKSVQTPHQRALLKFQR